MSENQCPEILVRNSMSGNPCLEIHVRKSTFGDPRPEIHVRKSLSGNPCTEIHVRKSMSRSHVRKSTSRAEIHVPKASQKIHARPQACSEFFNVSETEDETTHIVAPPLGRSLCFASVCDVCKLVFFAVCIGRSRICVVLFCFAVLNSGRGLGEPPGFAVLCCALL